MLASAKPIETSLLKPFQEQSCSKKVIELQRVLPVYSMQYIEANFTYPKCLSVNFSFLKANYKVHPMKNERKTKIDSQTLALLKLKR